MDQESLACLQQGDTITIYTNGEPEEWRKINCPGFKESIKDKVYKYASSLGRLCRNGGSTTDGENGYYNHGYHKIGINYKSTSVHQVVLHTFEGPLPHDTPDQRFFSGDHIDGDKTDNSISNLRWATNEQQQVNRGMKRVDRLEPGEPRELRKPPKKAKESVAKVNYGPPKSLLVYNRHVSPDDNLETVSTAFGIAVSAVRLYISQHYKSQDAEFTTKKLKITSQDIRRAYPTVLESQDFNRHRKGQSIVYTPFIHDALGRNCSSCELAASLAPRLFKDVCICTEQPGEDLRPLFTLCNSLQRFFKTKRAKVVTIIPEDLYTQLKIHGLTTNGDRKESWLKIIHRYVGVNSLHTGELEALDRTDNQTVYNLNRQGVLSLVGLK